MCRNLTGAGGTIRKGKKKMGCRVVNIAMRASALSTTLTGLLSTPDKLVVRLHSLWDPIACCGLAAEEQSTTPSPFSASFDSTLAS